MPRTVSIGRQDFEKIRVNNNFYVDKTFFLKEWWEADDEVTLIARPRRFGKTLTMSMVEKFFSVDYQGRSELFEGLSIWEEPFQEGTAGAFYHGFVLGLMVELADKYVISSNRESGFGRYDIMLEPKGEGMDAFVIEFKVVMPRGARLWRIP